ncbi:MAG TPA: bifunctional glutamine-synthetase adenylyltransferase/deadenyltransferase, partial [Actinomycetota bacterium]|nr:bifunctional glutamine-synthetase adenylyltransferase/deadenyltransferase [Actinomycetota bacterium]
QLQHGRELPDLRARGTIDALQHAGDLGLLSSGEVDHLVVAYRFLLRLRNRLFFLYGRPVDALPVKPEGLEALGVAMGLEEQPRQELEELYLRTTRRARRVSEKVIFD